MARVVVVDAQAWSPALLRDLGRFEDAGLTFTWVAEQNSALDSRDIASGRDIGNVAQRDGDVLRRRFRLRLPRLFPRKRD